MTLADLENSRKSDKVYIVICMQSLSISEKNKQTNETKQIREKWKNLENVIFQAIYFKQLLLWKLVTYEGITLKDPEPYDVTRTY